MYDLSTLIDPAGRLVPVLRRVREHASLIAASAVLLAGLASVAPAATYYVDGAHPAATDAGPGTSDTPYRTLQAAVTARAAAGNTIAVRPAIYRESVTIAASGSAASRIVLQAIGAGVVVTGADALSSASRWAAVSGEVYLAASVTWSPAQVFAGEVRLTPSTLPPDELPARSFRYVPGAGLYVHAGGGNPASGGCEVGRRSTGMFVAGAYVTVSGFAITRTEDRAIAILSGASNAEIANCSVTFANKCGIDARGAAVVISGNRVSDNGDHGIFLFGAAAAAIRDNQVFRNARPAVRAANGIDLDNSPGCIVERNRCHDNQDSGIQFYNGSNDALSRNNVSWNNGDHGFDHVRSTGVRHYHDVASGNYKDGFSFEGSASGGAMFDCIAANNGLTTGEFNLWVDLDSASGFISDYNLFWNATSRSPVKFVATQYASLSTYSAVSGLDQHSQQLDPRFLDASSGDFRLQSGSPAIDAALAGGPAWPATDRDGTARIDDPGAPNTGAGTPAFADIGAIEFDPGHPPVVSAPASAVVAEAEPVTFTVTATDPDGESISALSANFSGLPAGHDATFTTNGSNTSGTFRWTPALAMARAAPYTITFTAANARNGSASTALQVNPAVLTGNLCGNPGFENGAAGWTPYGSATVARVAGGRSGAYCLEVSTSRSSTFGIRDEPNWVATTLAAGTTYRFAAWVRSSASRGTARLKVREFYGSEQQGSSRYSPDVTLSSSWRQVTVEIAIERTGSTLDFEIRDYPSSSSERFQIDDVSIVAVTNVEPDMPPSVSAPAAVIIDEGQPVIVNVVASDLDGDAITALSANLSSLPSGHDAVFTPNGSNTGGTLTWTPTPSDGRAAPYTVTFSATNQRTGTATTAVTVTDGAQASNLCGNPGFETGVGGWEPYGIATLNHVTGGRSGGFCIEIRATGSATIGIGDNPNWIAQVAAPGIRYRYSAWVRSASHRGTAKLQVREFVGGSMQGSAVLSPGVTLSPVWQQITAEITTLRSGSVIETEVKDYPSTSGEIFQIDDFSITRIGSAPELADRIEDPDRLAEVPAYSAATGVAEFGATITDSPSHGSVALEFALTRAGAVRVRVFDVAGRQMPASLDAVLGAGRHRFALGAGQEPRLAPGAYFYRLSAPEGVRAGKFLILE